MPDTSAPSSRPSYPLPLPANIRYCDRAAYHHDSIRGDWPSSYPSGAIGVELEIEAINSTMLSTVCGLAHFFGLAAETDGSLSAQVGVEIVGPAYTKSSYDHENYRNNQWYKFLDHIKQRARGWAASTDSNSYGMHVSVNMTGLSPTQRARFQRFWCNYPNFVAAYAGRRENTYCRYYSKPTNNSDMISDDGRYEAAAARGSGRLEIRVFRSTIDIVGFFKNIDVVRGAWDLATTTTNEITPNAFLEYVMLNPNLFPSLTTWMKTKNRLDKLVSRANSYNVTAAPTPTNTRSVNPLPTLAIAEPIIINRNVTGPNETIGQYLARVLTAVGIRGGIQIHNAPQPERPDPSPEPSRTPRVANESANIEPPPPSPELTTDETFLGIYEIIDNHTLSPINGEASPPRLNIDTALRLNAPDAPRELFIYPIAWGNRDTERTTQARVLNVTIPLESEFVGHDAITE